MKYHNNYNSIQYIACTYHTFFFIKIKLVIIIIISLYLYRLYLPTYYQQGNIYLSMTKVFTISFISIL